MKAEEILRVVKERYSKVAQTSGAGEDSCCRPSAASPAVGFASQQGLYTPEARHTLLATRSANQQKGSVKFTEEPIEEILCKPKVILLLTRIFQVEL
jgi:hypothetical protein